MVPHQEGRRGGRWEMRDDAVGQSPSLIAAMSSPNFWLVSASKIFLRYSCSSAADERERERERDKSNF